MSSLRSCQQLVVIMFRDLHVLSITYQLTVGGVDDSKDDDKETWKSR